MPETMKNLALLLIISACLFVFACNKDNKSEKFKLLTGPTWTTDSLLANGTDASGPAGMLVKFKGDAKFKEDGTGYFGIYKGTWRFNQAETEITIVTDSLVLPIISDIVELTSSSFKIKTVVPNPVITLPPINIRMTFKAK
jgi:hypothetical protein